jgi:hypothetical protein
MGRYNAIMKDALKQKRVTRTYRNGKSVFQLEFIIRLRADIGGTKFQVTEQRAQFFDEKIIFYGKKDDAESFYDDTVSVTILNGSPAQPTK